jgi:pimeloyl-ACP methyl ester carboxylesterase
MLADALGIRRFNWAGWSSGGDVGLVLAALHGDRLGRMVSHAGVAGGKNTSERGRACRACVFFHSDACRVGSPPKTAPPAEALLPA